MRAMICVAILAMTSLPASSATIKRACLGSERASTTRLCSCIQTAADQTLSRQDQSLAASFFKDPDKAQEIRMSDRRSHEKFWERYRAFGEFASALCS